MSLHQELLKHTDVQVPAPEILTDGLGDPRTSVLLKASLGMLNASGFGNHCLKATHVFGFIFHLALCPLLVSVNYQPIITGAFSAWQLSPRIL